MFYLSVFTLHNKNRLFSYQKMIVQNKLDFVIIVIVFEPLPYEYR